MKKIIVKADITIHRAMKILNQSGKKCLVVVDEKGKLLGTLTDGDIRKAILKGCTINTIIDGIYQKDPTVLIKKKYNRSDAKKLFLENKYDLIPVIDDEGILSDIIFLESILKNMRNKSKKKIDVPVVIMAGGKGTRMEPFTKVLPKPLVPIDDKPIIEHIIEKFSEAGCRDFYMTINYKGKILKAYFEELHPDYELSFIEEKEPLGTAGSLSLLDAAFEKPFFVTNCDIIINADYSSIYEFHAKSDFDITLVASAKEYVIPYGTCEINDEGHLSYISEKPKYDFLINTGLYILNPEVLKIIPENKYYHITHLIEDLKNLGKKVGVFPIDDNSWIDIGQWAEYQKAVENL